VSGRVVFVANRPPPRMWAPAIPLSRYLRCLRCRACEPPPRTRVAGIVHAASPR